MIVVVHGLAGAGKDTVGGMLIEEYGFTRAAYADALREFLIVQNPWVRMNRRNKFARLADVIAHHGWQGYKKSPFSNNIRHLIQTTGTEAGRGILGSGIWVSKTLSTLPSGNVVITDGRFINEIVLPRRYGGAVAVKVAGRETNLPPELAKHISEQELPDELFDVILDNSGTIKDLRNQVKGKIGPLINKV